MQSAGKYLLIALFSIFGNAALAADHIVPGGWHTDLDDISSAEPIIENSMQDHYSQPAINARMKALGQIADAELFSIYIQLYEKLEARERPKLYQEQAKWLAFREKDSEASSKADEGGSLAPTDYWEAFQNDTKKRQKELAASLANLTKRP